MGHQVPWMRMGITMPINHQPVNSSNISSVGYDSSTQTLEVRFTSGSRYQYFDVPEEDYDSFMASPSKGEFFASQIKGVYRYSRN